jgi:hypothetical protein
VEVLELQHAMAVPWQRVDDDSVRFLPVVLEVL